MVMKTWHCVRKGLMALDAVLLTEVNTYIKAVMSVEQDHTTCMCRLVLSYSLSKMNLWWLLRETTPSSMAAARFKYNT